VGGPDVSDPQGLAFDPVAADYDLGRPVRPRELLEGIEGNDVLDLAAGTGKLTRPGMVATLGDLMPRDLLLGGAELTWLDRARRFAVHPFEQVERERAALDRGGYTLFTGDVGAALVAQSCLDVDPRFPTMDVW
jgi:hypothetical protein